MTSDEGQTDLFFNGEIFKELLILEWILLPQNNPGIIMLNDTTEQFIINSTFACTVQEIWLGAWKNPNGCEAED